MNREEFDRLERRFGSRPSAWPAPYRQEAAVFLGIDKSRSADSTLDRLILSLPEAAVDQAEFERGVFHQIGERQRFPLMTRMQLGFWSFPVAASVLTVIFIAAGLSGYSLAGRSVEMSDDLLLAFAMGETNSDLVQPFGLSLTDGDSP